MAGTVGVILLYFMFLYRGFRAAVRALDDFSRLLAAGPAIIFGLQIFIIIGGVVRLIPITGITLSFVSKGGSSIVANFVLLALLLRISDTVSRQKAARPEAAALDGGVGQPNVFRTGA